MRNIEILKELVLSTEHLPQWMSQEMDNYAVCGKCRDKRMEGVAFDTVEYGYMIWAGLSADSEFDDYPPEIVPAVQLARKHDCRWLRFDCDGLTYDGLPVWEWEDE